MTFQAFGLLKFTAKKFKSQTRIHCSLWNGFIWYYTLCIFDGYPHKNGFECWWNSSKKSYQKWMHFVYDQIISIPARTNQHKPQMGFQRLYLMKTNSFHFNKLGRFVLNILNDIGPIWNIIQFMLLIHFTLASKNRIRYNDTLYFDPLLLFYAAIRCVSISFFLFFCVCALNECVCLYAWSCFIRVHLIWWSFGREMWQNKIENKKPVLNLL